MSHPANLLIMTATVTPPPGALGVARADPALRLQDYRDALGYYITTLGRGIDGIVFTDNSSSDVSTLKQLARDRGVEDKVEFLSFYGLDYPVTEGRCYGEMRLLDYAMDQSGLIRAGGPEATIWKVTGRYKVLNILRILEKRPRSFDFYCDLRDNKRNVPWCDTRLLAWTPHGYDVFLRGVYRQIGRDLNQGREGEQNLYHLVTSRLDRARVVGQYRIEPLIDGVRAEDNNNWNSGRHKLVYMARSTQRKLLGRVVW